MTRSRPEAPCLEVASARPDPPRGGLRWLPPGVHNRIGGVRARSMYQIAFAENVADDLAALAAHERRLILDRIDEQLTHTPTQPTRNKKILIGLVPPWDHVEPV